MKSYTNSCETIKSSQRFLSDGNNETFSLDSLMLNSLLVVMQVNIFFLKNSLGKFYLPHVKSTTYFDRETIAVGKFYLFVSSTKQVFIELLHITTTCINRGTYQYREKDFKRVAYLLTSPFINALWVNKADISTVSIVGDHWSPREPWNTCTKYFEI